MTVYGTLIGWRAYAEARGDTAPGQAEDAVAQAALVRATDYIRANFPRAVRKDPPELVEATYIAASYELTNPGFWSKTWTSDQQRVLTEVGSSIKWSLAKNAGNYSVSQPRSPLIEGLLAPYGDDTVLPGIMVV